MANRSIALVAGAALAVGGCATAGQREPAAIASAQLTRADGAAMGTATIVAGPRGRTTLLVSVSGLTPGTHGIHLHAIGKCEAPKFTSAGGHLNPAGKQHGMENPAGSHLGDLPNLDVAADGTATLSHQIDIPARALQSQVFDADGTAIVVHAGPDDYRTDPSGNSGGRVSCGVFTPG
jgi:superoxide dismutase, Cu-Zn family